MLDEVKGFAVTLRRMMKKPVTFEYPDEKRQFAPRFRGLPSLRARIARHYRDTYGLDLDPARVAVTTGSSGAFILSFLSLFEPGDRVALANPGYPPYRHILTALGCEPVLIETSVSSRWVLSPDALIAAHRKTPLKGVIVASPANPSGTVMEPHALAALITAAHDLGIRFISDEIYHRLVYEGVAETALATSNEAIVINSFSKYYCMTGWRIGWMVLPEDLVRPVERLAQNLYISAPDISQRAAIAAFDASEELDRVRAGYAASRKLLLERLPAIGFTDLYPCVNFAERETWVCGPTGLLDATEEHWSSLSISDRLHTERFRPTIVVTGEGGTVRFGQSDVDVEADAGTPILTAGEAAGVIMPSGCRMGICFGCVVPLREGAVRDLRTGALTTATEGDGVKIQTCISAAAGECHIDL